MWLRVGLVLALALGACGGPTIDPNEPQTAKEKQRREAQASGDVDPPNQKWGAWRYQGERKNCFYVLGRRCFKTEKAACAAAACKTKCDVVGGGPATVSCTKSK